MELNQDELKIGRTAILAKSGLFAIFFICVASIVCDYNPKVKPAGRTDSQAYDAGHSAGLATGRKECLVKQGE